MKLPGLQRRGDAPPEDDAPRLMPKTIAQRLRNNLFTGIVVAAPISITVYLTWSLIDFIDRTFTPLIPQRYNPETYLPFTLPGLGVIVALFLLMVLGALTTNLIGRRLLSWGESIVDRMPVVRSIYNALKQIVETVVAQRESSFRQVGLIEYPRRGLWAIVFVTTDAEGEIQAKTPEDSIAVFLPTTPNPTSGFLLFVPRNEIIMLDMSIEEAAKLVISAGLVTPEHPAVKARNEAKGRRGAAQAARSAAE